MPSVAKEPAEPRFVVMLVYPGVVAMDIFGPLEAFAMANAIARRPLYRLATPRMRLAPVHTPLCPPLPPPRAGARLQQAHRTPPPVRRRRPAPAGRHLRPLP